MSVTITLTDIEVEKLRRLIPPVATNISSSGDNHDRSIYAVVDHGSPYARTAPTTVDHFNEATAILRRKLV